MQMRIFVGNDVGKLERQIQDWLEAEEKEEAGAFQIHYVTHAIDSKGATCISAWWSS